MVSLPHYCTTPTTTPGRILCKDMVGPIEPSSTVGEVHFAKFTDVTIRYFFVVPLRNRSEVYEDFTTDIKYTTETFDTPSLLIHSDIAKEYVSRAVREAIRATRAFTPTTIPYNPEENGIEERLKRTLLNGTHCVPATAKLLDEY